MVVLAQSLPTYGEEKTIRRTQSRFIIFKDQLEYLSNFNAKELLGVLGLWNYEFVFIRLMSLFVFVRVFVYVCEICEGCMYE